MLEKELLEIINKDLPNQVGESLKTKLQEADFDNKKVKELTKEVKHLNDIIDNLRTSLRNSTEKLEKHKELDLKISELERKTRDFEISVLSYQLEAEKEKTEFTKNVTLGLVRNIEYRKSIFDSETKEVPVKDNSGYVTTHFANTTKSYTETTSTE